MFLILTDNILVNFNSFIVSLLNTLSAIFSISEFFFILSSAVVVTLFKTLMYNSTLTVSAKNINVKVSENLTYSTFTNTPYFYHLSLAAIFSHRLQVSTRRY